MVNRKEIELIAKKIQDDNPGMTKQTAIQYAEKNTVNKKKNQKDGSKKRRWQTP